MTNSSRKAKLSGDRIVFFGSGPVAAESLRLLSHGFEIEAVVTKPSTVKDMALVAENAHVYTVENRQELDELVSEHRFESSVGILIDFGIIVSQKVIDTFELGIINSHFSLLPEWRGADPITYALLSGQDKTGVSLMLLTAGMDEGSIIAFGEQKITSTLDSIELTEALVKLSDALLKEMLPKYIESQKSIEQFQAASLTHKKGLSYSRRLLKEDGLISWHKPATVLEREIRAFKTWPKSRVNLGGVDTIITKARVCQRVEKAQPGKIVIDKKQLFVATAKDWLQIISIQPVSKKEMSAESFLAGYQNRITA